MNVLVACEESQRVCTAFREKGHNAFSCDILPCSGGHPEWHIQVDVLEILNPKEQPQAAGTWHGGYERYSASGIMFSTCDRKPHWIEKWDLIIAHPPCTYLSNAGARFLYPKGVLNQDRLKLGLAAKEFFMAFYNADCEKICIENPTPSRVYELPKYTQVIQPWMFGHPVQKRTCLWLKGLEPLKPTEIVEERQSSKVPGNWFNKGGKERQQNRAKTFNGIAKAFADQWG
jgi:hypothetical protein